MATLSINCLRYKQDGWNFFKKSFKMILGYSVVLVPSHAYSNFKKKTTNKSLAKLPGSCMHGELLTLQVLSS